jgi:mono/diheme cytochrome c family protein
MILAAPAVGLAQSLAYNVGAPLSQDEIKSFDFMIGPEGQQLPAGRGTAKEGAVIFAQRCEVCHGKNGQSGVLRRLVLGSPANRFSAPSRITTRTASPTTPMRRSRGTTSTARCRCRSRARSPMTRSTR